MGKSQFLLNNKVLSSLSIDRPHMNLFIFSEKRKKKEKKKKKKTLSENYLAN